MTTQAKKWLIGSAILAAAGVVLSFLGVVAIAASMLMSGGSSAPGPLGRLFGRAGAARAHMDGNKPVGLWFMTKFWIATGSLEKSVWYFAPNGKVYQNPVSLADDDLENHSDSKGTYHVDGDTMTIEWSDGQKSESKVERDTKSEGFAWDTGLYSPVKPFDDTNVLVGTWEGGESLSHGGNYVAASRTLHFNSDGTFTRESVASVKGETDQTEIGAGSQSSGSGKWSIDDLTMTLTDADGKVTRGIAFPFDDESTPVNPDRFFFAGTMYKKQE